VAHLQGYLLAPCVLLQESYFLAGLNVPTNSLYKANMIRHTVAFKLKHPSGSEPEAAFLASAQALSAIPGVRQFECLRQVGKKNTFTFGLSMEFASQQDYDAYNTHSDHVHFVEARWKPEVLDFIELDYVQYGLV
jgi:heme-degrading monooxygenase HmoA